MDITAIHQIFLTCTSVTTDSRNCPQGSLFIALKGESFNGNAFAARALESGSAYAIVDEEAYAPAGDTRYIVVENSLKTLQQLANYHRRQMRTPIIGITGTNGKTTTKELMSTVLSQTHNVLYTLGNLNNHIGVPLTLLRLRPEHDLAVVEMGASHPGDIKELVEIAEPDYGIITNVGKAHLEGFGSFEGIIKTKGEMYDYLRTRKEATIFIHNDNPYLKKIAYGLHQIAYGSEDGLYINGHVTGNSPYLTFEWKTDNESKYHEVQTRLIGEYNFPNALAAVTIGHFFGVEPEKIDKALAGYTPQNNRSQLKKTADNTLISVDAAQLQDGVAHGRLHEHGNIAPRHHLDHHLEHRHAQHVLRERLVGQALVFALQRFLAHQVHDELEAHLAAHGGFTKDGADVQEANAAHFQQVLQQLGALALNGGLVDAKQVNSIVGHQTVAARD